MKRRERTLSHRELRAYLLHELRGRVFHVTCRRNAAAILSAGKISSNSDGQYSSAFGSSQTAYYRLRDCVSVFDYRDVSDEQLEHSLSSCAPDQALDRCGYELAVFVLAQTAIQKLDLSGQSEGGKFSGRMVVWYVEAGYPGDLPINEVTELLEISVEPPTHPHLDALRQIKANRE